jgi:hypothetical protein
MSHIHPTIVLPVNGTGDFQRGLAVPPPATPVLDSVLPGDSQNTLNWTKVTGATGYKIYYDVSSPVDSDSPNFLVGDVATYTQTGLSNGTLYYYKIRSVGVGGVSGFSNELSATPSSFVNEKSLLFDGINEYVSIANPSNFHFETGGNDLPFSVSAWCKMVDATAFQIITKGATANREWGFRFTNVDKIIFKLFGNAAGTIAIGRTYNTALTSDEGSWVHYLGTYDGSGVNTGIKIYRNSTELSLLNSSAGSYTSMFDSGDNVEVGQWAGVGNADGNIDEVSVWTKELTQSEINNIYNGGTPNNLNEHSAVANLESWWRNGDGDTFPTITDNNGSNDGTMTNMESGDIVTDVP